MLKFLILFSTDKAKQQAQKVHQIYILSKYVKLERTKKNAQENKEQENTSYPLCQGKIMSDPSKSEQIQKKEETIKINPSFYKEKYWYAQHLGIMKLHRIIYLT